MKLTVERTRTVDAVVDRAWSVVSDMAAYADHAAGLAETEIIQGAELGAVRRCIDATGADWHETCVMWEPGSQFAVEVDVASYPLKFRTLFSAFRGTWSVTRSAGSTVIGIRFDAELRPLARPLRQQIERRIKEDLDEILESYARAMIAER